MNQSFTKKIDTNTTKLLAFDIDGTLFSSEEIILPTYQEAIEKFLLSKHSKIIPPSKDEIIEQIGKPVKTIFQNLFPNIQEKDRDTISQFVLEILCKKIENGEGILYESVRETIYQLFQKQYTIVTASNGRKPYIETILKTHGLNNYFQDIVTLDYHTIKTKGDILDFYKKQYNLDGSQILMIGDRSSDRDAALQADTHFVFTSFGHASKNEISNFSKQIDSIGELLDFL
ncbi:MAG: HAD family hydrolase [Leptospiraceae bacterium]|nr:HAD family hydrolase [Leptospiraceae bacterium]MCP5495594.1 HAD family hydrolase [Leptospiraceae bacterium]